MFSSTFAVHTAMKSIALVALLVCSATASGQTLPDITPSLDSSLAGYLSVHELSPEEYIIGKFDHHDIVFLGEFHKFRQNLELLHRLIPMLYGKGVYTLASEFARREDQPLIDSLLSAPEYDDQLARRIMFQHYVLWPYQEYVDVYRAAWNINHELPAGSRLFRILGVNGSPDWSFVTKPEDRDNPEVMARVWRGSLEDDWGKRILDSVVAKGEKALVYSGTHHAFTEYRQPRVFQGEFRGWGDTRMGNVVYDAIGKRAITIVLHHPWFNVRGWDEPLVFPADGYIDAFFREHSDIPPVGFDTRGTPFGELPGKRSLYHLGYDNFTLGTYCDGYVYVCPFSDYKPVTLIDDFINESNLSEARSQSPDPALRTASIEEFRARARKELDFQGRMPGED